MSGSPGRAAVRVRDVRIFVSTFTAANDTDPSYREDTLAEILGTHEAAPADRRQLPGYSCARFRRGGKRCRADVELLSAVVLDLDHLTEAQAKHAFDALDGEGLAYAAHSTLSHGIHDQHCYRVVLPLSRWVTPAEYAPTVRRIVSLVGVPVDQAVLDVAHRWTFPYREPSRQSETDTVMVFQDGRLLEPETAQQPVTMHAGTATQPLNYDLDSLKAWLTNHPSQQADIQEATLAICNGEAWDNDGQGRDSMLWRTVASIARRAPGATQQLLEELVAPSVAAVRAEGSKVHMGIARKKIQAALKQAAETPLTSTRRPRGLGQRFRRERVALFVAGMLDRTSKGTMPGAELLALYRAWAAENGGKASDKVFSEELKKLGITRKMVHGKSMWPVQLKAEPLPGPGPSRTPDEIARSMGMPTRVGASPPPRSPPSEDAN